MPLRFFACILSASSTRRASLLRRSFLIFFGSALSLFARSFFTLRNSLRCSLFFFFASRSSCFFVLGFFFRLSFLLTRRTAGSNFLFAFLPTRFTGITTFFLTFNLIFFFNAARFSALRNCACSRLNLNCDIFLCRGVNFFNCAFCAFFALSNTNLSSCFAIALSRAVVTALRNVLAFCEAFLPVKTIGRPRSLTATPTLLERILSCACVNVVVFLGTFSNVFGNTVA